MAAETSRTRTKEILESIKGLGNYIQDQLENNKHSEEFVDRIFDKIKLIMKLSYEMGVIKEYRRNSQYISQANDEIRKKENMISHLKHENEKLKRELKKEVNV